MIVKETFKYSYQGPIYKNGMVFKLLDEPIWTEASNENEAYTNFIFRIAKAYGTGASIKREAIHVHVPPIDYDAMFSNVNQVVEHFAPTEEEAPVLENSKKSRKKKVEDESADEQNS